MKIKLQPLTDNDPCPVKGVHYGQRMMDVPARFLDWFRGQSELMRLYPTMAEYTARMKKVIDWELEEGEQQ